MQDAASRKADPELRRADLETELQLMEDDRTRLATELDVATARLARVETALAHLGPRVRGAIGTLREVLARAEPPRPGQQG
ncbi:MAG: DUF4164 family protein [Methylobacteriaceae bacterium]|nr:DUF4164 family protein [Methylobacteriaceae bacterium]